MDAGKEALLAPDLGDHAHDAVQTKVYKRRWFIVGTYAFFSCLQGWLWGLAGSIGAFDDPKRDGVLLRVHATAPRLRA